ncbi:response regulator [Novosphingobium malaysiense]|uniref:Response regulator n=1 Tax=Novosphingobium malaysiense TaxID=1348853 RepID=A0A0B1ZWZ0_9SPHN|nr:response regulator [Novosphingobium malaysiense]
MASATGSARAQLIAIGEDQTLFNWATDMAQDYVDDFIAIEGHRADVNYRVAACARPFEVTWEHHYDAVRAVNANDAYLDHVRRWDAEHGAQMVLANEPNSFFGLAALHSRNDGRTTEEQRRVLEQVGPSALSAIRLQRALEHRGAEMLRNSLEAMRNAAILLDSTGRVCAVTPAAEALLGSETVQVRSGTLRAMRPDVDASLQNIIGSALDNRKPTSELWLRTVRGPTLLEAFTLPRQDWAFGFAPRVIVTMKSPLGLSGAHPDRLGAAFGLTRAEGEIVSLLVQGHSRQQIATIRGVSVQTVASQLRTIFVKCDVNREAELVSIARAVIEMAAG